MTSNTFSLCQMFFLRIQAVRTFFGIPKMADHSNLKTDSGGFMDNLKAGRHRELFKTFSHLVENLDKGVMYEALLMFSGFAQERN